MSATANCPGFGFGFNAVVGVPLLVPSFLYEGVHQLHHARTRYGTVEDPEYLPLALMKPWTVPLFVLIAAFGPLVLVGPFWGADALVVPDPAAAHAGGGALFRAGDQPRISPPRARG